jgi:hypothetical protein
MRSVIFMKQKARIRREKERLYKQLQRAARNPEAHREQLQAILLSPVATTYQKNQAKELLEKGADELDGLLAAYDKKPTVAVGTSPAPSQEPDKATPEPPKPELSEEELHKRYQQALEQRAQQYRAEMDKTQRVYELDWWKGWQ